MLLYKLKISVLGKAVHWHIVASAIQKVEIVQLTGHHREQKGCGIAPNFRIALPHKLFAVLNTAHRFQFCA